MSTPPGNSAARKVWYFARNNKKFGPYTNAEFKRLAQSGRLQPSDMVRHEDRPRWVPASSIPDLLPATFAGLAAPNHARRRRKPRRFVAALLFLCVLGAGAGTAGWFFWPNLVAGFQPSGTGEPTAVAQAPSEPTKPAPETRTAPTEPKEVDPLDTPTPVVPVSPKEPDAKMPPVPAPKTPVNDDPPKKPDFTIGKVPTPPAVPSMPTPADPPVKLPNRRPDTLPKPVRAALDWIAAHQEPDGRWKTDMGNNRPAIMACTAFCALALMADGPDHAQQVDLAARYAAANLFDDLKAARDPVWDQSNWTIGIGGLFLCEYYAFQKKQDPAFESPELQAVLEKIVAEACERMETSGGWGHTPRVKNALNYIELEIVSNWMLATLGAARRLGIKVPEDKLNQAIKFVEDCCNAGEGGVGYSPRQGQKGFGCPCRTGGAVFAFGLLDRAGHPLYPRMVDFMKKEMKNAVEAHGSIALGFLCAALGFHQVGETDWQTFSKAFFPTLLDNVARDGSIGHLEGKTFFARNGADARMGKAYNTGIYALALQLDRGTLSFLGQRTAAVPVAKTPTPAPAPKPAPEPKMPRPDTTAKLPAKDPGDAKMPAEPPPAKDSPRMKQVRLALDWLVKNQQLDGHWKTDMGSNPDAIVVTTSFAALALMASGGRYEDQVGRAANYVIGNLFENKSGMPVQPEWDQSNWKIGIGGLFLCEYHQWLKARSANFAASKALLDPVIQRCVDESCKRMETSGGWGHTPRIKNPLGYVELEIMSNWHLPMLGAAKQIGFKVPADKVAKAVQFIEACCDAGQGGVGYSPNEGQRGNGCPCLTGGALFAYAVAGQRANPHFTRMALWWRANIKDSNQGHGSLALGYLCSALGARQLGAQDWNAFLNMFSTQLLGAQDNDGSFKAIQGTAFKSQGGSDKHVGATYTTAIYALLLELDNGKLKYLGQPQR